MKNPDIFGIFGRNFFIVWSVAFVFCAFCFCSKAFCQTKEIKTLKIAGITMVQIPGGSFENGLR